MGKRICLLLVLLLVAGLIPGIPAGAVDGSSPKNWLVPWKSGLTATMTQGYDSAFSHNHGFEVDFNIPSWTPIYAPTSGNVIIAGWDSTGYGYLIKMQTDDGFDVLMAHNSSLSVGLGRVNRGQLLGYSGSTGNVTGAHMHFEIRLRGAAQTNNIRGTLTGVFGLNLSSYKDINRYKLTLTGQGAGCAHTFTNRKLNTDHEVKGHRALYFCSKCGQHDGKVHEEWGKVSSCNQCYPSQQPGGAVRFTEHHDAAGWSVWRNPPFEARTVGAMGFANDQLSCVEIFEDNIEVTLYEHDQYNGRAIMLKYKGRYNLGNYNFNDICSSYRITRTTQSQSVNIENGAVYYIRFAGSSNLMVDLKYGDQANGVQIWAYGYNQTPAQQWRISNVGGDLYILESVRAPGKVIELQNSGTAPGTRLQTWTYYATYNTMKWRIYKHNNGTVSFVNAHSGLAIDLAFGTMKPENIFLGWTYDPNNANQRFVLIKK